MGLQGQCWFARAHADVQRCARFEAICHRFRMTDIVVTFRPHWINGWFVRLFARPYVSVDGEVIRCSWSNPTQIQTAPGTRQLQSFIRYRRLIPGDLGCGELTVALLPGSRTRVMVSNGWANHTPFTPRLVS